MKLNTWKATLVGLLVTLPLGACDCGGTTPGGDAGPGITCGPGTLLKDGQCVAGEDPNPGEDAGPGLECGPGTVLNSDGTACIPDIECADGTVPNQDGTGCVAACADPFILQDDQCVCPAGLMPGPGGDDCIVDPALCAEGTIFDEATGQCAPVSPPPPGDDDLNPGEAPATFILPEPDENKRTEIGGIVGPVGDDGQGDLDVFEFEGDAGDRLLVQLVSFGAQAASFILVGTDDNTGDYFRMALPLQNRRAVRHVVLPVTGSYAIIVSDRANVLDLLGVGGIPVGGEDHTYSLVIDALPVVSPTTIEADGAVHTGAHDNIDAYRVNPATTSPGAVLNAFLAANDADPDFDTVQVLWYIDSDGDFVELEPGNTPAVNTLLPQVDNGTIFYVDYQYRLGVAPAYDYNLSVVAPTIHPGPAVNGGPVDGNTGGENISFFEITLEDENVYRARVRLPASSTIPSAELALIDEELNILAISSGVTVDGVDYEQLRYYAGRDAGGLHYLAVLDDSVQDPTEESNFNVRLTLDGAPIAASGTLSLPGNPTFATDLDDPATLDEDAWTGPWALLRVNSIADLQVSTRPDVTFDAFDATSFASLPGFAFDPGDATAYGRGFRGPPGMEVLVQATGGDQTGQFTLAAAAVDSPYRWESEPNDTASEADPLEPTVAVLPDREAPAPVEGACTDLTTAPRIEASGHYTATIIDAQANFTSDDWGGCALSSTSGRDVYYVIPQQPAGVTVTIETLSEGDNAGTDTHLGIVQVESSCDPTTAVCLEDDDDAGDGFRSLLEYSFTGSEGDVLLIIDSYSFSGLDPGTLLFDVTFSDPPTNGFTSDGDVDWWALTVSEPGYLNIEVEEGPLGGNPDTDLTLYGTDATTVLGGPVPGGDGLRVYVEEIGTYYASVEYFSDAGDYTISWSLDPSAEPPVTCFNPIELTGPGDYTGNTEGALRNWIPADDSCFGYSPSNYNSPDHLYRYTLPAGATLRAVLDPDGFDAALALLDGGCESACLAGSDGFGDEEVSYQNTSGADKEVFLVVDGYSFSGSADGPYDLTVEIFGSTCTLGEERCTAEGNIEVCNSDGTGFDVVECPAGCEYDDFEQAATCNQHCGEGTDNPVARCEGATLQACSADLTRYEDTACDIACSDFTDGDGRVVDATCSFGVCTPTVAGCADDNGVFVESTCNEDGSALDRISCLAGCNVDGTACETYTPTVPDLTGPNPTEGACDLVTAPEITGSGTYRVSLTGPTDDFGGEFGSCTVSSFSTGTDVYWKIPAQAAGTVISVEVLNEGANGVADTKLGLVSTADCASGTCLAYNDDGGDGFLSLISGYTVSESDGDMLLIVDTWSGDDLVAGDIAVRVELTPVPAAICNAGITSCDDQTNILTACTAAGDSEESLYCDHGCNPAGSDCWVQVGENCERPEPIDVSADIDMVLDLSGFERDMTGDCSSSNGRDRVFSFTAPVDGQYVITTSERDTTLYRYEGACGDTIAQCSGDVSGIPPSGWGSRLTFSATAGTEHFFVVDLYGTNTTATDVRLEIDVPDAP